MKMPSLVWIRGPVAIVCFGLLAVTPTASAATAQCSDPNTPAGYLLQVVHEIAANGDLTDRKSLETILETKFDAHPVTDGPQAGHRVDYSSTTLFGHPAAVDYTAIDDPGMQKRSFMIAALRIRPDPSQMMLATGAVTACLADLGAAPPINRPMKDAVGSYWTERVSRTVPGGGSLRLAWKDPDGTAHVNEIGITLEP
jgi:hypothetical protein